jgi:hypothetical protein
MRTCDCGKILKSRSSRQCPFCYQNRNDLSNRKIGKWTVLGRCQSPKPSIHAYWKCRCECGAEQAIAATSLKRETSRQCRNCYAKERGPRHPINIAFSHVRGNATRRNISFAITKEEAYRLLEDQQFRCALTGLPLTLRPKCNASLDRIDSGQGYTPANVQWVHKTINLMKWILSTKDFVGMCKLVVDHCAE